MAGLNYQCNSADSFHYSGAANIQMQRMHLQLSKKVCPDNAPWPVTKGAFNVENMCYIFRFLKVRDHLYPYMSLIHISCQFLDTTPVG